MSPQTNGKRDFDKRHLVEEVEEIPDVSSLRTAFESREPKTNDTKEHKSYCFDNNAPKETKSQEDPFSANILNANNNNNNNNNYGFVDVEPSPLLNQEQLLSPPWEISRSSHEPIPNKHPSYWDAIKNKDEKDEPSVPSKFHSSQLQVRYAKSYLKIIKYQRCEKSGSGESIQQGRWGCRDGGAGHDGGHSFQNCCWNVRKI